MLVGGRRLWRLAAAVWLRRRMTQGEFQSGWSQARRGRFRPAGPAKTARRRPQRRLATNTHLVFHIMQHHNHHQHDSDNHTVTSVSRSHKAGSTMSRTQSLVCPFSLARSLSPSASTRDLRRPRGLSTGQRRQASKACRPGNRRLPACRAPVLWPSSFVLARADGRLAISSSGNSSADATPPSSSPRFFASPQIKKNTSVSDFRPSDLLIERFTAWKRITKMLISYFEGIGPSFCPPGSWRPR